MKIAIIIAAFSFFATSGSLFAFINAAVEISPNGVKLVSPFEADLSDKHKDYQNKVKLTKQEDGKLLLTLPQIGGNRLEAVLVVCKEARKDGNRNFRNEIHWPETKADSPDIELIVPVRFEKGEMANIQLTEDLASRSYVVFGGFFLDGTFYTIDLPSYLKALD